MPTLIRLLLVVVIFAAIAFGVMTAMVTFFQPQPHVITQTVTLPSGSR